MSPRSLDGLWLLARGPALAQPRCAVDDRDRAPMTIMYRLHLFGRVVLEQEAQPAWRFPTRKAMALLGYLARQPHSVPRSELTNLLWGDLPDTRSRRNLTRELSQLSAQ